MGVKLWDREGVHIPGSGNRLRDGREERDSPRFRNEEHVWGSTGRDQMGVLEDLTFIPGHSMSQRPCREECAPIPVKWEV